MSGFLLPPTFAPPQVPPIVLGSAGQVLTMVGGVPTFVNPGSAGIALGKFTRVTVPAGTTNNLNPVPIGPPAWPATYGRVDIDASAGDATLTGMVAGYDGQMVLLRNAVSNNVIFSAEDAGSLPGNQFLFYFNAIVVPQQSLLAVYYGPSTGVNSGAGAWVFTGR